MKVSSEAARKGEDFQVPYWIKSNGSNRFGKAPTEEFKHLLHRMLDYKAETRLSIEEVMAHPWYTNNEDLEHQRQTDEKVRQGLLEKYSPRPTSSSSSDSSSSDSRAPDSPERKQ